MTNDTTPKSAPRFKELRPENSPSAVAPKVKKTRRVSQDDPALDEFYIPQELRDELTGQGLSFEWKRITYMGKEESPGYFMRLEQGGWEPLSLSSFPSFKKITPRQWVSDMLEAGGQRLYVRPLELTDEARQEDFDVAEAAVRNILPRLQDSPLAAGRIKPVRYGDAQGIRRSYERAVE